VDEVLMDLVVTPAATIDELADVDDRYERELLHVLESVAAERRSSTQMIGARLRRMSKR
jgi:hypothetical protein